MQRNEEGIVNNVFSETGDAANPAFYSEGFTTAMSTPGSGQFPPRTAFNFLFKILTALAVDVNSSGCLLPWDALVNYYQGARVVGTDNKVYIATTNNGPATDNGANPAQTPVPSEWQLSPEYSFGTMAQQNADAVAITDGNIAITQNGSIKSYGEALRILQSGGNASILFQRNDETNYLAAGYYNESNIFTMGSYNDGGSALEIDTNGNKISFPNGINDSAIGLETPAAAAFTKAIDSGEAPTLPAQLTNKAYVDAVVTTNSNGICYTLPGGLKLQTMHVTMPSSSNAFSALGITFPVAFSNTSYVVSGSSEGSPNNTEGSGILRCTNKTSTGCTVILDTNSTNAFTNNVPLSLLIVGK